MEKLIHNNITITDGDLTELSARRAQTVREQLLEKGNRTGAHIRSQSPIACPGEKRKGEGQPGRF